MARRLLPLSGRRHLIGHRVAWVLTHGTEASVGYESHVRIRKPCIMLVRIEPAEEPLELGLAELTGAVQVLRVRHPIPACQRMQIVRPLVVILGESVRSWALPYVEQSAREVDAVLLQLGPLVVRDALRDWLRRALDQGMRRRFVPSKDQATDEGGPP